LKKTVMEPREAFHDDLTGKEIKGGGWELRGIGGVSPEFHFQGITDLLEFFISGRWDRLGGRYFLEELVERGVLEEG